MDPLLRRAARLVVIDPENSVLLFQYEDDRRARVASGSNVDMLCRSRPSGRSLARRRHGIVDFRHQYCEKHGPLP